VAGDPPPQQTGGAPKQQNKPSGPPVSVSPSQVKPMQLVINPNVEMRDRPVVALTMAILTNTDVDLTLTSDHRIRHATLGVEDGVSLVGDLAMARYLVQRANLAPSTLRQAQENAWADYSQSLTQLAEEQRFRGIAMTLEHALQYRTYLVGSTVSMADVALFGALGWPSQANDLNKVISFFQSNEFTTAVRWTNMLATHPAVQKATQLAVGVNGSTEADFGGTKLDDLVSGMNLLEGATPGNVVTRFPPEPSGYLHIGHAKAVLLNDYFARRYKGRLIVRFDDTNPSKEKEEYQQAIVEDLKLLGVQPAGVTFTSDYFAAIYGYAMQLIDSGLAYMDDTPQEQMKEERADRIESKHRSQTPAEAKDIFLLMNSGNPDGSTWCLRAKIDMNSDNGTLRDPVLFRQNLQPHHRSGTTYKAYPTYDLACPIVDSLEGVTHAMRTTEYEDRNEQYQWIQKALSLRQVRIHAFSRVNFMYTVLSKRKLAWFVEQGLVEGWGDARFPTVRGVVRRGVNLDALKSFIYSQGASRRVVNMDWSKFWAENKKEIDKRAKRFMAIDFGNHANLKVTNAPALDANAYLTTPLHPKDPSLGSRALCIGQDVMVESVDVDGIQVGEDIVLMRWGVVKITKKNSATDLEGEYIPDGDFRSAKRKLSWLTNTGSNPVVELTEFDHLVTKEKLEEEDKFSDYVNPTTMATTQVLGDCGLKTLQEDEIIQLERRGFFRVDRPYMYGKPLVLYMIPDGKSKAMSGLTGKLAHH
jgi:glutamyl-tRNA synthetase